MSFYRGFRACFRGDVGSLGPTFSFPRRGLLGASHRSQGGRHPLKGQSVHRYQGAPLESLRPHRGV